MASRVFNAATANFSILKTSIRNASHFNYFPSEANPNLGLFFIYCFINC